MRLLLDTQVYLWCHGAPRRLGKAARAAIEHADNEVWVSIASLWEISIKQTLGKLEWNDNHQPLETSIEAAGFRPLHISAAHVASVRALPPLHRDPFDRLLLAQTRLEHATLVTADIQLPAYGIPTFDAR